MSVSCGWTGEGEETGEHSLPLLLGTGTLDSYQDTHIYRAKKVTPALNTSSLTSFLKCHLAPEWQCQQWQLSRKEHLRRAATVSPSKLMLEACDSLSQEYDFPYVSLNIEK